VKATHISSYKSPNSSNTILIWIDFKIRHETYSEFSDSNWELKSLTDYKIIAMSSFSFQSVFEIEPKIEEIIINDCLSHSIWAVSSFE